MDGFIKITMLHITVQYTVQYHTVISRHVQVLDIKFLIYKLRDVLKYLPHFFSFRQSVLTNYISIGKNIYVYREQTVSGTNCMGCHKIMFKQRHLGIFVGSLSGIFSPDRDDF